MRLAGESANGALSGRRGWTQALLAWALLAIGVGLLLRLRVALSAPWYGDEGYVAELAQALGRAGRPSVGGLWHDGFFPLSSSWIAPWSASPLALFPGWTAMTGVRLWALLWEGACLVFLALLGARWGSARLGAWAASAYAVLPFGVQFGGRAFYHHFATAFMLGGLLVGQRALETGRPRDTVAAGLALGLSVATCYWLWWLPLTWLILLAWRQPRRFWLALFSAGVLPVAVLSVQILQDPTGAAWSIASLLQASTFAAPKGLAALGKALMADLGALSFLILGLLGMAWALRREPKRWAWPALALLLAILEPVRQRGDIVGLPYPFILAAPLAALGVAVLLERLWQGRGSWALGLVLALAWLRPIRVESFELRSFDPEKLADLQGFFGAQSGHRGVVCGLPAFNWALRPTWQVCEPFDVALYDGRPSAYYAPKPPLQRFAHPCGLSDIRYAVLTRQHFISHFRFEGVALTFLQMERQHWPMAYDGRAFKVYENPAYGAPPDPQADLLRSADNYVLAAAQAHRAGLLEEERYAQARALALGYRPGTPMKKAQE